MDGGRNVAVVGNGVGMSGVQAEPVGHCAERGEVAIAVSVDEREPQDGPGQIAVSEYLLSGDFAGRVGKRRCVCLQRGSCPVAVVHVACAVRVATDEHKNA